MRGVGIALSVLAATLASPGRAADVAEAELERLPPAWQDAVRTLPEVAFPRADWAYGRVRGPGPYMPEVAARMGVGGFAVITCRVMPDGALKSCTAVAAIPPNFYFQDAALNMAERKWIRAPQQAIERSAGAEAPVHLLVRFPRLN